MTEMTFYKAIKPTICKDCEQQFMQVVAKRPDLNIVSTYCEHSRALIVAHQGEHEGERAILRWEMLGPMTTDEAREILDRAGRENGAPVEDLNKARVH